MPGASFGCACVYLLERQASPSDVLAALPSALATLTAFEAAEEPKRMLGMALHTLLAVALMSCTDDPELCISDAVFAVCRERAQPKLMALALPSTLNSA